MRLCFFFDFCSLHIMELEVVKKRLEERHEARYKELEFKRLSLLSKLRSQVNDFLSEFPAVTRLVVFGSLTRQGYFTKLSDVDIAVSGLPNALYWDAMGWLENCLKLENIDLVRLEDANPRIIKHIDRGETLYDKKPSS